MCLHGLVLARMLRYIRHILRERPGGEPQQHAVQEAVTPNYDWIHEASRSRLQHACGNTGLGCNICMDEGVEVNVTTLCGHTFHSKCLLLWCLRQTSPTCPMCRNELKPDWIWESLGIEQIILCKGMNHGESCPKCRLTTQWQQTFERWDGCRVCRGYAVHVVNLIEARWIGLLWKCCILWNESIQDCTSHQSKADRARAELLHTLDYCMQCLRCAIRRNRAYMGQALSPSIIFLIQTHLRPMDCVCLELIFSRGACLPRLPSVF